MDKASREVRGLLDSHLEEERRVESTITDSLKREIELTAENERLRNVVETQKALLDEKRAKERAIALELFSKIRLLREDIGDVLTDEPAAHLPTQAAQDKTAHHAAIPEKKTRVLPRITPIQQPV